MEEVVNRKYKDLKDVMGWNGQSTLIVGSANSTVIGARERLTSNIRETYPVPTLL